MSPIAGPTTWTRGDRILDLLEIPRLQQFTCSFSVLVCFNTATAFLIWILEHNIDWLVLSAISSASKLLLTNGGFCFSYLFDAWKVGDAACDKPLSLRKRFSQSRGPACPCAEKAVRVLRGGNLVAFWFLRLFFFFFLLGRTLCGCQRPFASLSLGIVGKAGSLPSIPGTFWGFGFWFFGNGGAGTWDASCVFTSEHCAECAFLGLEWSLVLGKRILPNPRKWRWLFMRACV